VLTVLSHTHAFHFQKVHCGIGLDIETGLHQPHFAEAGAKINGQYHRDVLLMQELLPAIGSITGDVFIFQQDSAPAHRASDTVEFCAM